MVPLDKRLQKRQVAVALCGRQTENKMIVRRAVIVESVLQVYAQTKEATVVELHLT